MRCGAHGRAGHHEAPHYELLAQQHAEHCPNSPCDHHHPVREPNCKENREATEKIKCCHGTVHARSETWDGAEAQPRMLLLPQGMKSQHRREKEVPEIRGKTPSRWHQGWADMACGSSLGRARDAAATSVWCEVKWFSPRSLSPEHDTVPGCSVRCQPMWVPQPLHHLQPSPNSRSIQKTEKST